MQRLVLFAFFMFFFARAPVLFASLTIRDFEICNLQHHYSKCNHPLSALRNPYHEGWQHRAAFDKFWSDDCKLRWNYFTDVFLAPRSCEPESNIVPGCYEDAIAELASEDRALRKLNTEAETSIYHAFKDSPITCTFVDGFPVPLVLQVAAIGEAAQLQKSANNIASAHLGNVNQTYRGLCSFMYHSDSLEAYILSFLRWFFEAHFPNLICVLHVLWLAHAIAAGMRGTTPNKSLIFSVSIYGGSVENRM